MVSERFDFFLITSFLFYTKLLESKGRKFDWSKFFVGRILRLTPLYLFAVMIVFVLVTIASNGVAHDSALYITKCIVRWLSCTMLGAPNINQVDARIMVAGVVWSLPYEWIFYFALPLLGLTARVRAAWPLLALSVASLVFAAIQGLTLSFATVFAAGMIAALFVRDARFTRFAGGRGASLVVVVLALLLLLFPTAFGMAQLVLLTGAFSLIAAGTNCFGVLTCAASKWFGEFAYSIYLLHGILLFVAINFIVGVDTIHSLTPVMYWLFIAALVPVLLGVCFMTFQWIEKPGMSLTPHVLKAWRRAPKEAAI